ncbi:hypothetical protein [Bacillus sp. OV166]|uniref:hypothetical protein n=1 Tax=Bacillus sp. OV166 TaxID=1882763 RepID=UPI0015C51926|nr:hypothetical protein [Bacillus sp. OV166]
MYWKFGFSCGCGMMAMCVIGSESTAVLLGIKTLFFMTKRMGTPPLDSDNRDDLLFYLLFAGLIYAQLFEWYHGLGDVESFSILDWSPLFLF